MRGLRADLVSSGVRRAAAWLGVVATAAAAAGCAGSTTDSYAFRAGALMAARSAIMPTGMSSAEADAVIARAITEHEIRRP
jgi:hypothetical protein